MLNKSLAAIFTLALCLSIAVVAARFGAGQNALLGISLVWWDESAFALMGLSLFTGFGWLLARDLHLRIDVITSLFPNGLNRRLQAAGLMIFGLPTLGLLAATCLPYVATAWQRGERSMQPSGLGFLYLVKTILILSLLGLILGFALRLLRARS